MFGTSPPAVSNSLCSKLTFRPALLLQFLIHTGLLTFSKVFSSDCLSGEKHTALHGPFSVLSMQLKYFLLLELAFLMGETNFFLHCFECKNNDCVINI